MGKRWGRGPSQPQQGGPQGRGKARGAPTLPPTPQGGPAGAAAVGLEGALGPGLGLAVTLGADRAADHAWIIANATLWTAIAFRGRAVYDRVECPSLEEARSAAPTLYRDRPVGIYAVVGGRSTHVENYEPKRRIRRMKRSTL